MKKIVELLTQAEAEAKALADKHPSNGLAQALRGRCKHALEMALVVEANPPALGAPPSLAASGTGSATIPGGS